MKAWVPKSYVVNNVGLDSFGISKHRIHYMNVDSIRNHVKLRKRIAESSNLRGARYNIKIQLVVSNGQGSKS